MILNSKYQITLISVSDYHVSFILHEAGAMDSGVSHGISNCSGGGGG